MMMLLLVSYLTSTSYLHLMAHFNSVAKAWGRESRVFQGILCKIDAQKSNRVFQSAATRSVPPHE